MHAVNFANRATDMIPLLDAENISVKTATPDRIIISRDRVTISLDL
jgi:hypothetical protein